MSDDQKTIALDREERRTLYGLLEAKVSQRLRRIEVSVYALLLFSALRETPTPTVPDPVAEAALAWAPGYPLMSPLLYLILG